VSLQIHRDLYYRYLRYSPQRCVSEWVIFDNIWPRHDLDLWSIDLTQTDTQTDTWTDTQTDTHTDTWTDTQTAQKPECLRWLIGGKSPKMMIIHNNMAIYMVYKTMRVTTMSATQTCKLTYLLTYLVTHDLWNSSQVSDKTCQETELKGNLKFMRSRGVWYLWRRYMSCVVR